MNTPTPPGWQWTMTITGHKQLEHVASKFAFSVPRSDEYAQAMAAVLAEYRRERNEQWLREVADPLNPKNQLADMIQRIKSERRDATEEEWAQMHALVESGKGASCGL